jgi:hypothetical protein
MTGSAPAQLSAIEQPAAYLTTRKRPVAAHGDHSVTGHGGVGLSRAGAM